VHFIGPKLDSEEKTLLSNWIRRIFVFSIFWPELHQEDEMIRSSKKIVCQKKPMDLQLQASVAGLISEPSHP
jgi:hypothetical protein